MRSSKLNLIVVFMIALTLVFGCNLRDQGGTDEKNDSKQDSARPGEAKETPDNTVEDDSATEISDIDFPDDPEPSQTAAEEPERRNGNKSVTVKFGKGKTSRSYSDAVIRAERTTYSLKAGKGQTLSVNVTSLEDNAVFRILTPGGKYLGPGNEEEGVKRYSGTLPQSGSYRIVVTPTRGNATYKINFNVTGGASKPNNSSTVESVGGLTTNVRFKKGASSAAYKNAVIRGQVNKYILGASRGQTMNVTISSTENNAVFAIDAPNGRTLVSEKMQWTVKLPASGKYRILVGATRGNATYTIRFAVR